MLLLSREQILSIFTMRDAIEADKKAFVLHTEGKAQVPLRINLDTEDKSVERGLEAAKHGQLLLVGLCAITIAASVAILVYLLNRLDTLSILIQPPHH